MKMAVRKIEGAVVGPWFAGVRSESMRAFSSKIHFETDDLLATWPTQPEALAYALTVIRLREAHPDRTNAEVRDRARDIVWHG